VNFQQFMEMSMPMPPHLPRAWWGESLQKAQQIESQIKNASEILKDTGEELESDTLWRNLPYLFRQDVNAIGNKEFTYESISQKIKWFLETVDTEGTSVSTIKNARKRIGWTHENEDFKKDFAPFYNSIKEFRERVKEFEQYGEPERQEAVKRTQVVVDNLIEYIKLLWDITKAIKSWSEREEISYHKNSTGKELLPSHQPVEILYHATPFVQQILKEGFKTKSELPKQQGLGGSTQMNNDPSSEGIAFTGDINIARAIVRSLIDAINIAQGRMTISDVAKLMQAEMNPQEFKKWAGTLEKAREFADKRQFIFQTYRSFLMNSKKRYDPTFFGVNISNFEHMNVSNVGIIAAKVDMTKIKKYLTSMEEFRVPKDAILNIRNVK